jgi:asparagine synthase (glutamine-hydrolysing)
MQPFTWQPPTAAAAAAPLRVVANGEIYNYRSLAAQYGVPLATGSDCEVLAPLYDALDGDAVAWARALDGVFAVVLVDAARGVVVVARDPYGVRPLFTAELRGSASTGSSGSGACASSAGSTLFASEIKGLLPAAGAGGSGAVVAGVAPFPPGHVATYDLATGARLSLTRYHAVPWIKNPAYEDAAVGACVGERGGGKQVAASGHGLNPVILSLSS